MQDDIERGFNTPDCGPPCPLPDADRLAAVAAVWKTALPNGLALRGPILDAVVVKIPHNAMNPVPKKDELILMVDSGAAQ